ncbi:MAG: glycosyltransferase family 2 protein [Candidatus Aenigmatarchaeota archaeon]|nr:MAG: glycosyltransferase family 2 protein [Candidatus Aenigmarchaeota archaeon]
MKSIKYSMVIPVYNEEEGIRGVLVDVKKSLEKLDGDYEIVIVDDASSDRSIDIVKNFDRNIRIVKHEENEGYGASILDGVRAAKSNTVIIIDADGTYPANEIPNLVKYSKDYALVTSSRTGKNVKIPLVRRPGKFFHTKLISFLVGMHIPDMNSGLRVFKKDVFMKFASLYPKGFSISTTFLLSCITNDYPVKFIPIDYYKRKGKSKIKIFRDGYNFVLLILKTVTYFNPLRIFMPISIAFLVLGLAWLIYNLITILNIPDASVLLITLSIIIGIFGLMADMISRLFKNIYLEQKTD